jgi:hypothetical protein
MVGPKDGAGDKAHIDDLVKRKLGLAYNGYNLGVVTCI